MLQFIILPKPHNTSVCLIIKYQLTSIHRPDFEALKVYFPFLAPELCESSPGNSTATSSFGNLTFKSDFWSLGCVLYEMYTGAHPFPAKTFEQYQKVFKIHHTSFPSHL